MGAPDSYETLLYGVHDAVATLTLNRPDRRFADYSHAPRDLRPAPRT